jgi:crotonobetainyl-CoA:carnitine CoA-transferase CaiB-like acyl-CoA transferase
VDALHGVRVLDLSAVLAGPLCTQYLADLGAEVIKVESPRGGDEVRGWPPFREGMSTAFLAVNRNKKSVALDLKTAAGRAVVHRLAKSSDVVVESNSTGVSERLGIDDATLRAINPKLVYCAISGFGRTGPLAADRGYDMVMQAFTGIMALTGEPGGGPVRSAFSPVDQTTGLNAVIGILAGLIERGRTGTGTYFEVSLFETAVSLLGYHLQKYWETGTLPQRVGAGHESRCPYQAFETADSPLLLGVANDPTWRRFCRAAGLEELAEDPRYATNSDRLDRFDEVVAIVQEALRHESREGWLERLIPMGIPCSPLNTIAELSSAEHTAARGILMDYEHPLLGPLRGVALPIQFDAQPRTVLSPPPLLGQHTAEVLRDLGYSPEEIGELREAGAVAGADASAMPGKNERLVDKRTVGR